MTARLDFIDKSRYDEYLIDSRENPFPEPPARSAVGDSPAKFLVGRTEHLHLLESMYSAASQSGEPKLGIVQGSQGVGKSSLISWFVKEKMRREDHKIFVVPFEMTSTTGNLNFEQFYNHTIKSLFDNKDLYWIANRVMINIIRELEEISQPTEFEAILQKLKISRHQYADLKNYPDNISTISNASASFISQFWDIFQTQFHSLSEKLPTMDFPFLEAFFFSIYKNQRTFQAFNALVGRGEFESFEINSENDAKRSFRTLLDIIGWISPNSIILTVIDHLEAAVASPAAFIEVFSLLIQLRQQRNLLVLLSGTFDAFNSMDLAIKEDMGRQIRNWAMTYRIMLNSLKVEEVVQIINQHLTNFWIANHQTPPASYPQYPYSKDSIEYLYLYNNKDLRYTLETCYHDINTMKESQRIKHVHSVFDAFKQFRLNQSVRLKQPELKLLRQQIMNPSIQDNVRSKNLEKGLFDLLSAYAQKTGRINNVRHEPAIGRKRLKPDVYFEIGKGLGNTKRIAIEVKLYRKSDKIPAKEVKKTHSLLASGDIDYLLWYSNKPLDQVKYKLDTSLWPRVGRDEELSESELGYAGVIYYYQDIVPDIVQDPTKILQLMKFAGIDLEQVFVSIGNLETATEVNLTMTPVGDLEDHFGSDEKGDDLEDDGVEEVSSMGEGETTSVTPPDSGSSSTFVTAVREEIERNSEKSFCAVKTIIKGLNKRRIDLSDFPNADDLANTILKIADDNGYKTTATRVYFK